MAVIVRNTIYEYYYGESADTIYKASLYISDHGGWETAEKQSLRTSRRDGACAFEAGDELEFNLMLIGRTIVYFNQYLQAFYYFGMQGMGAEHVRFQIAKVSNTLGETLVEGSSVYKERLTIMHVSDYVRYRFSSGEIKRMLDADRCRMVFQSPLSLKFQGKMQEDFRPDALFAAIERRVYILNCYEGLSEEGENIERPAEEHLPIVEKEKAWPVKMKRYSGTQNSKVTFSGIRGWCDLRGLDESMLQLLLAGELLHIGKNTSFGFGKYTLVNSYE